MPYRVSAATYSVSPSVPQTLGHKPMFAMPYEPFDGPSPAGTDIRYLSVGLAQYDETEVSAKTMRHTGDQWSPQSEELPVHRVFDLAIFAAKALLDAEDGALTLHGGLFENQENSINISKEDERTRSEIEAYESWKLQNEQFIKNRINALSTVIDNLRRQGKL